MPFKGPFPVLPLMHKERFLPMQVVMTGAKAARIINRGHQMKSMFITPMRMKSSQRAKKVAR